MNDFGEILIDLHTQQSILKKEFRQEKHDIFYLKTSAETLLRSAIKYKNQEDIYIDRFDLKDLNGIISETRKLITSIEKEIQIQANEQYFNLNNNNM